MSENYRDYTLNDTGDSNWGPQETQAFKDIINKLPSNHTTLVSGEHVHSALVAPSGSGAMVSTGSGLVAVSADALNLFGTAPTITLKDGSIGLGHIQQSGPTITMSPGTPGGANTVSCNPAGVTIGPAVIVQGPVIQIDGGGSFPGVIAQSAGATAIYGGSTSVVVDGDAGNINLTGNVSVVGPLTVQGLRFASIQQLSATADNQLFTVSAEKVLLDWPNNAWTFRINPASVQGLVTTLFNWGNHNIKLINNYTDSIIFPSGSSCLLAPNQWIRLFSANSTPVLWFVEGTTGTLA